MSYQHPEIPRSIVASVPRLIGISVALFVLQQLSATALLFIFALLAITRIREFWEFATVSVDDTSVSIRYFIFFRPNQTINDNDNDGWNYSEIRTPSNNELIGGYFGHSTKGKVHLYSKGIENFSDLSAELCSKI